MSHFIRQSTLKTKFASSFISRTRKFVRAGIKGKKIYLYIFIYVYIEAIKRFIEPYN